MSYFAIDNVFHIDVTRIFVGLDDYVIHDLLATKKGINRDQLVEVKSALKYPKKVQFRINAR